tara:strand:- start:48 stop:353 length:306 start_codon:yes stop_codon:yes gene_type:complete
MAGRCSPMSGLGRPSIWQVGMSNALNHIADWQPVHKRQAIGKNLDVTEAQTARHCRIDGLACSSEVSNIENGLMGHSGGHCDYGAACHIAMVGDNIAQTRL